MSSHAFGLLQSITKDPHYAEKLQGLVRGEGEASGGNKSWNNRFHHGHIPKYDAFNDRFCKFSMRGKKGGRGGKAKQLDIPGPPSPGQRGESPGKGMFANTPVRPQGTAGQVEARPTPRAQDGVVQSVEALHQKSKQRMLRLWDEVGVPEQERQSFPQMALASPSTESIATINDEIQRLLDKRNDSIQVEKAIEVREGFLYLLHEVTERYGSQPSLDKDKATREVMSLLTPMRNASLDCTEAILRWKETTRSSGTYMWKGVSYLHKMASDVSFLAHSRLAPLVDMDLNGNPFFDPRKGLDGSIGGRLPPLRRGGKGDQQKDIPRERIIRAEKLLAEEVQRQLTLLQTRSQGAEVVEEDPQLALLDEEEERHQLVVQEDEWLQNAANRDGRDKEWVSALKIQTAYRGFRDRRFVKAKIVQRQAAVRMQTLARQYLAKKDAERRRDRVGAAKRLQSLQRGIASRNRIHQLRLRKAAAVAIQRVYRGHRARRHADLLAYIRYSAVNMQRVYRGHCARKRVRALVHQERTDAATYIQKMWRGYVVRRSPLYNPKSVAAAVKLQAWSRGILDRRVARFHIERRAASTTVQAWWRGVLARARCRVLRSKKNENMWQLHVARATVAATKIQSVWRMCRDAKRVRDLTAELFRSRAALQEAVERHQQEEQEAELRVHNAAATRIGAVARGHLCRRKVDMFRQVHGCAVQIQKLFRGHMGRLHAADVKAERIEQTIAEMKKSVSPVHTPGTGEGDASILHTYTVLASDSSAVDASPDARRESEDADVVPPTPDVSIVKEEDEEEELAPVPAAVVVQAPAAMLAAETESAGARTPACQALTQPPTPTDTVLDTDGPKIAPTEVSLPEDPTLTPAKATSEPAVAESPESPAAVDEAPPLSPEDERQLAHEAATQERDEAAKTITSFLRTGAAVHAVDKAQASQREERARLAKEEREQVNNYSASILQRFGKFTVARRTRRVRKSEHARSMYKQVRQGEQDYAAIVLQRQLFPYVAAVHTRRARSAAVAAPAKNVVSEQEAHEAACIIQRFGLRIRVQTRKADATEAEVKEAERMHACIALQRNFRCCLARSLVGSMAAAKAAQDAEAEKERELERAIAATKIQTQVRLQAARKEFISANVVGASLEEALDAFAREQETLFAEQIAAEEAKAKAAEEAAARAAEAEAAEKQAAAQREADRARALEAELAAMKAEFNRRVQEEVERRMQEQQKPEEAKTAAVPPAMEAKDVSVMETQTSVQQQLLTPLQHSGIHTPGALTPNQASPAATPGATTPMQLSPTGSFRTDVQQHQRQASNVSSTHSAPSFSMSASADAMAVPQTSPATPAVNVQPAEMSQLEVTPPPNALDNLRVASPAPIPSDVPTDGSFRSEIASPTGGVASYDTTPVSPGVPPAPTTTPVVSAMPADVQPDIAVPTPANTPEPKAVTPPQEALPIERVTTLEGPETTEPPVEPTPTVVAAPNTPQAEHVDVSPAAVAEIAPESHPEPVEAAPVAAVDQNAAAVLIQKNVRGHIDRVRTSEHQKKAVDGPKRARAVLRIQCLIRVFLAKVRTAKTREARRGYIEAQRRDAEERVARAQREEEGSKKLRSIKETEKKLERAAVIVQRAYRCYNARFMLWWKKEARKERRVVEAKKEVTRTENASATKIQCLTRRRQAKQKVDVMRAERQEARLSTKQAEVIRNAAALKLQCAYRCYNARFEVAWRKEDYQKMKQKREQEKAMKNQEEANSRVLSEMARSTGERHRAAAIRIQCAWRCYNARFERRWRTERKAKQQLEAATTKRINAAIGLLQRTGRGHSDRVHVQITLGKLVEVGGGSVLAAKRQFCAKRIQRAWRGKFSTLKVLRHGGARAEQRKALLEDEARFNAAVTIQCMVRSANARLRLKQTRADQPPVVDEE